MGRDIDIFQSTLNKMFQSTRPYGARLYYYEMPINMIEFQSTRPYGARLKFVVHLAILESFNPRARMGRDIIMFIFSQFKFVSIHAPVWGATLY